MRIYLIGVGMGNLDTLTLAAMRAVEQSDLLIGASRLLEPFGSSSAKKRELIVAEDIVAALEEEPFEQASVLFSGDVGFYSGATKLIGMLGAYDVEVIPGISSLVYFCAKVGVPWQDASVVSAHGREHNAVGIMRSHAKTFCLTGGKTKAQDICRELVERGLGDLEVAVGERLSYADERVVRGSASSLSDEEFADLAVMLVTNLHPLRRELGAPSLPDSAFERGDAPMTKQEVRALAIAKLRIAPDHVVWDVGAGTGSVSIEAARAAHQGAVYAVEKKEQAAGLLERNRERFGTTNLVVVRGSAPEVLEELPAPDCVFVGGSSGSLGAIVDCAVRKNPRARICVAAVTLETLSDVTAYLRDNRIQGADIVQVAVSRADELGAYHLMRAENPVYLATFCSMGEDA